MVANSPFGMMRDDDGYGQFPPFGFPNQYQNQPSPEEIERLEQDRM